MSSFQVVDKSGEFPYVKFAGSYCCEAPSIVEAIKATEIEIEGIAGVTRHQYWVRIYPQGRFCCGQCAEWKVLDVESRAWAVRSAYGGCPLVNPKLVCEDCIEGGAFLGGCRYAVLAHDDFYVSMRNNARKALVKPLVTRWQGNAKLRKERRELAIMSGLVFKRVFFKKDPNDTVQTEKERPEGWQQVWNVFIVHANGCK